MAAAIANRELLVLSSLLFRVECEDEAVDVELRPSLRQTQPLVTLETRLAPTLVTMP